MLMSRIIGTPLRWVILVVLFSGFCLSGKLDTRSQGNLMAGKAIEDVLKEHTKELMSIPGVVGTGQSLCDGKPCIKVYVVNKTPELEKQIPQTLEGYPVVIEETGEIRVFPKSGTDK